MTYVVETPSIFLRSAEKFIRRHPELEQRFTDVVRALSEDPFQPSLRLHPLAGKLAGLHAVSLTYKYRLTLTLLIDERRIILLDIGSLEEVYGCAR